VEYLVPLPLWEQIKPILLMETDGDIPKFIDKSVSGYWTLAMMHWTCCHPYNRDDTMGCTVAPVLILRL
jgi:hypothetical protein